ncbi:MAG TPA: hypothetical protein VK909_09970, partial [Anaerolineales bacterium]|nr:hypothetical protein [Anaerolineales bacterium]
RTNMTPKMAAEQHISQFNPTSHRSFLSECGLGIEYFGTIYNLSPFLSLVSLKQAERQLSRELESRSFLGMILVAVGIKS